MNNVVIPLDFGCRLVGNKIIDKNGNFLSEHEYQMLVQNASKNRKDWVELSPAEVREIMQSEESNYIKSIDGKSIAVFTFDSDKFYVIRKMESFGGAISYNMAEFDITEVWKLRQNYEFDDILYILSISYNIDFEDTSVSKCFDNWSIYEIVINEKIYRFSVNKAEEKISVKFVMNLPEWADPDEKINNEELPF